MIDYIKDVDLFDHVREYNATLIGTNICYFMRNGIQRQVSINYPYVYDANMKTKYMDNKKMGTILECKEDGEPTFILCFINNRLNTRPDIKPDYLSYESLEQCLKVINILYKGQHLASPLLGVSRFDGNGDKERIKEIFERCITDIDLTIYDYEQKSRSEMFLEKHKKELEIKKKDWFLYQKIVKERAAREKEIKKRNGRAKY